MEYNYIKIGERIRNERKKLGVSQEKLLDNIRDKGKPTFGRNTLSSLENGDKDAFQAVNVAQLMALCEEFDCSIGYLLGEYEAHNYDNEFICKNTGLWEGNINKIKNRKNVFFLNALVSSKFFDEMSNDFFFKIRGYILKIEVAGKVSEARKKLKQARKENKNAELIEKLEKIDKDFVSSMKHFENVFYHRSIRLNTDFGNFMNEFDSNASGSYERIFDDYNSISMF